MHTDNSLKKILSLFPTDQLTIILPSLREDPLVWNQCKDPAFLACAEIWLGSNMSMWTPGNLALISLNMPDNCGDIQLQNEFLENESNQKKASAVYEGIRKQGGAPQTLSEAGWVAIALLDRIRSKMGREEMLLDVSSMDGRNGGFGWKTAIACAYDFQQQDDSFLRGLFNKRNPQKSIYFINHILFCHPLSMEDQIMCLHSMVAEFSGSIQVEWVKAISMSGRPTLAKLMARKLLENGGGYWNRLRQRIDVEASDWVELSGRALGYQQLATLCQFAEIPTQAKTMLEASQETIRYWLAGLAVQTVSIEASSQMENANHFRKMELYLPDHSASVYGEYGMANPENSELASDKMADVQRWSIFGQIQHALRIWKSGEKKAGTGIAREAVGRWVEIIEKNGMPSRFNQFIPDWKPYEMIQALLTMEMYDEAWICINAWMKLCPNDLELMKYYVDLSIQHHQYLAGLEYARIIRIYENTPLWTRKIALLLENLGMWQEAWEEWEALVSESSNPSELDLLKLAQAACNAGGHKRALEVATNIISTSPSGQAYYIAGSVLGQQNHNDEAIRFFQEAVNLEPENSQAWLMLAEQYQKTGNPDAGLETLQKGVAASPSSAVLHFSLGKEYLRRNMNSEALPYLEQAQKLDPNSLEVTVILLDTLFLLGHSAEAEIILESASKRWAGDPRLAYLQARLFKEHGELDKAIRSYEIAISYEKALPTWCIDFAALLIEVEERSETSNAGNLARAQQLLQRALVTIPDHFWARYLLGKTLLLKGEIAVAYALFCQLTEMPESSQKEPHWKLQADMGRAALALGMIDTALAILQEIAAQYPRNEEIHRTLAEAYLRANLDQEAIMEADAALQLSPANVDLLSWYARVMEQLGSVEKAVDALRCATQINPKRADLIIRLANLLKISEDASGVLRSMDLLLNIDQISNRDRWQAAVIYEEIHEYGRAMDILMGVLGGNHTCAPRLYLEIARISEKLGNLETAVDMVQMAIDLLPQSMGLFAYQADLFSRLGKYDAAIACYKLAISMADPTSPKVDSPDFLEDINYPGGMGNAAWRTEIARQDLIQYGYACLLRDLDHYQEALEHAEDAVRLAPDNPEFCYLAADLANSLLYEERAYHLLNVDRLLHIDQEQKQSFLDCYGLAIEMLLSRNDLPHADSLLATVGEYVESEPRLLAASSRIHLRKGGHETARHELDLALSMLKSRETDAATEVLPLWIGVAEIEFSNWKFGMDILKSLAKTHPNHPGIQVQYLRSLVKAAETSLDAQLVRCEKHLPPMELLERDGFDEFHQTLAALDRYSKIEEVQRWRVRGMAAFRPTPTNLKALQSLPMVEDDPAALARGLRISENQALVFELTERYPASPELLFQLVLSSQAVEMDHVWELARKLVEIVDYNPVYLAGVALLAERAGLLEDAEEAINEAVRIWNDEPGWHAWAAELNEKLSDFEEANVHWKLAVQLSPSNINYLLRLAYSLVQIGETNSAIEVLDSAKMENETRFEIYEMLALIYLELEKYQEALECAQQFNQLDGGSTRSLVQIGRICLKMERFDLALQYAQQAWEKSPVDVDAILLMTEVLDRSGRVQDALIILEKMDDVVVSSDTLGMQQARLIWKSRGAKNALPVMQELMQRFPEHAEILNLLAEVQAECGTVNEAVHTATTSLKIRPEQPSMHLLLGRLHRGTGQLDQAVHHFGEAIRQSPANIDAYLELGRTYQEQRQQMQAVRVYQQAMKISPDDYRPYYHAAIALRETKDYQGAEALLRRAVQLSPDDVSIRRQLAAIVALNMVYHSQEMHS